MKTVAIIPAKSLVEAKSRLAAELPDDRRTAVALNMLRHVIAETVQTPGIASVGVVSKDEQALEAARELGAMIVLEHGQGLNHALYLGRRWALEQVGAGALLVVLSDLPLLKTSDLTDIVALGEHASVVIAPSKDGGTNALLLRPPDAIPFRFGPASASRHAAEAGQRGLAAAQLQRPTLAFDVDTPEDVRTAFGASLAAVHGT